MESFEVLETFTVSAAERDSYQRGVLWQRWLVDYPMLFDESDRDKAEKNACRGIGFYEGLAAIRLFETTGYLALVDYYQYAKQTRKNALFRHLVGSDLAHLANRTRVYCPDLLVYKQDLSDFYFVEVKGGRDRLRPKQCAWFQQVGHATGKPIYLINIKLLTLSQT